MAGKIIVGGGQAGASLVAKLRALGDEGEIMLICEEPVPPYQRPPLSKKYLLGEMERERLFLRPESFYADQNIALRLNAEVTGIDRENKTISIGDEILSYDMLALTTGSTPRRLPAAIGGDLDGVHVVRNLADVDAMAPDLEQGRVLVVGGGYIGLEAAAVARGMGRDVTLVELSDRILQRVAAPATSDYFRALHLSNGVEMREGTGLNKLIGKDGRVVAAELSDGNQIDVDCVIVGVGIVPNDILAREAGLEIDNGIAVNTLGQTSDPSIWAAGDCASFPHDGKRMRLESVQNAIDQAEQVAANMLGADTDYRPYPWFWSDQYDLKLQIAGLNTDHDRVVVRKMPDGGISHWYYRNDQLLAVDAMNDPRAYMVGKRLIEMGKSPDPEAVSDPETNLKALLKA